MSKLTVHTDYQTALKVDPRKKGVSLYRVTEGGDEHWVWARTKEQALAAVAVHFGAVVTPHRVGVQMETPPDVTLGAWEGAEDGEEG